MNSISKPSAAMVEAQQRAPSAAAAKIEGGPPGSGGWEKHAIEMERQRDYYRQRCHTMEEHQKGGVWYWQGDDGDNLESMGNSMLVVMRADQLRSLIQPSPTPQADSVAAPAGGGVVAPSEPTSSMYRAAQMILLPTGDDDGGSIMLNTSQVRALWQAMLAAAPTQPAQAADSVLEDAALLARIMQAIRDYHFAMDNREHGGVAMARAWNAICDVLNMDWVRGAESAARKQGGAT